MAVEIIKCPVCGKEARVTYEENRIYQMKCYSCNNTVLHEDKSFDAAVSFFKRCMIPPCKVGDTVYAIVCGGVVKMEVESIHQWKSGHWKASTHTDRKSTYWEGYEIDFAEFGKTVFLSREEAESALAKENT